MNSKLIELANLLKQKGLAAEARQLNHFAKGFWCDEHECMKKECGCSMKEKKEAAEKKREAVVFDSCLNDVKEWLTRMKPKAKLVSCCPDKLKERWEKLSKAMQAFEKYSVGMP